MSESLEAMLFAADPNPLHQRVLRFNFQPSRFIHPKQLRRWGLQPTQPRDGRLDRLLLEHLNLVEQPFLNFEAPGSRLALLDGETLHRTVLTTGVALSAKAIARVVTPPQQKALHGALGETLYRFALMRASWLVGRSPWREPELPNAEETNPREVCYRRGLMCLAVAFSGTPCPLRRRLALFFEPHHLPQWPNPADPRARATARALLKRILCHEVDPSCAPLFT